MKFLSANEAKSITKRTPEGLALLQNEIEDSIMESISRDIHSAVVEKKDGIRLNIKPFTGEIAQIEKAAYVAVFESLRNAGYDVTAILNDNGIVASQATIIWATTKDSDQSELF